MWLPRQLGALERADRPVVLVGGERYGVPFVLDALRTRRRTAWWALGRSAFGDEVAQGNALAGALNRLLEAPLFGEALPYATHVQSLRQHAHDLRPLWIAVTTDRDDARVVADLVDLYEAGYGIVIDWRGDGRPTADWVERCRLHGPEALRVTRDEATSVVPGGLGGRRVEQLWRLSEGRFHDLIARAHAAAQLPALAIPAADGPLLAAREGEGLAPDHAVRAMVRAGDLVEALELAVLAVPHLVGDLIRQAGAAYQERGLHQRLHLLLSALPLPYAELERVLEWRLVAAVAAGDVGAVIPAVDAHLAAHVAPELRARRAGVMANAAGFAMAEAAVTARRTPLTVWQYGRLHHDPGTAARLLEESVRLAEEVGTPIDVARNAGTLGAKLLHQGDFARARAWIQWALEVFDQHQLRDGARRLMLVNDLAYARVLTGDLAGLCASLADAAPALDGTVPHAARLFRSTWAAAELVSKRPEVARDLLEPVVAGSPRGRHAAYAHQLVRVWHELGRYDEAARLGDDAVSLAAGAGEHAELVARLARGMAGAVAWAAAGSDARDPRGERAGDDLLDVMLAKSLPAEQRLPAVLHYLLVRRGAGHHVPADLAPRLGDLHRVALHLFSGPAALFEPMWDSLGAGGPTLRLRFFGPVGCRIDGRQVDLTPRMAEVALALTLHPEGLSRDALNDFLTPDGQTPFTSGGLRGLLTRLRSKVPVSEAPYRWCVPFAADVVEVEERLAAGRAREAVALWQAPLLPASDAPGVREARAALEEGLRQVALCGGDADALYDLATRLGDDLELWEATAAALPPGDPRLALARARCRRLAHEYA